jgi:hypothetical protein
MRAISLGIGRSVVDDPVTLIRRRMERVELQRRCASVDEVVPGPPSVHVLASRDMRSFGRPKVFLQATDGLFDAEAKLGVASHPLLRNWMGRYLSRVTQHGG